MADLDPHDTKSKLSRLSVDTMYKVQSYLLEASDLDKVTKRIIGPYAQIQRKKKVKEELEKEGVYLNLDRFNVFIESAIDLDELLYETSVVLKTTTDSSGCFVYLVDKLNNEIVLMPKHTINPKRHEVNIPIREGVVAAAHVAATKEYLNIIDVERDTRFSQGLKWTRAKVALDMPVIMPNGDCYAVLELYRTYSEPYDEKIVYNVLCMACWAGAAVHQARLRLYLTKTEHLNQELRALLQSYFCDAVSIDTMLTDMLAIMKYFIGTMKSTFYILDRESHGDGVMADMWEDGWVSEKTTIPKKKNKINLGTEKSPAAYVANTGEFLNLSNAYKDSRFSRDIDATTGMVVRTVLAAPIMDKDKVIGVCQLTNKTEAKQFDSEDEEIFKVFVSFCSLVVHFYNMQQKKLFHESLNKVYCELLGLHLKPCPHELEELIDSSNYVIMPLNFKSYNYHISEGNKEEMAALSLLMFNETFGGKLLNRTRVADFVITVIKCYRKAPYHNAEHAFTFTHTLYLILTSNQGYFDYIEIASMMLAALCHDLDHPGVNNNFLTLCKHPLAAMYKTSMLEHHHYFLAKKLIQDKKILSNFSHEEQDRILDEIKYNILATDLAVYFQVRAQLSGIMTQKLFDWNIPTHRRWLKSILMTSCDLSGCAKPFGIVKAQADAVYEEFYAQTEMPARRHSSCRDKFFLMSSRRHAADKDFRLAVSEAVDKMLQTFVGRSETLGDMERELGYTPLSMMDRTRSLNQPAEQIQFLTVVVLPCLSLVQSIFPNVIHLVDNCKKAQESWHEEIEMRGQKLWKQAESLPIISRVSKLVKTQSAETHASLATSASKAPTKTQSVETNATGFSGPASGSH